MDGAGVRLPLGPQQGTHKTPAVAGVLCGGACGGNSRAHTPPNGGVFACPGLPEIAPLGRNFCRSLPRFTFQRNSSLARNPFDSLHSKTRNKKVPNRKSVLFYFMPVEGIEPPLFVLQTNALPLSYTGNALNP